MKKYCKKDYGESTDNNTLSLGLTLISTGKLKNMWSDGGNTQFPFSLTWLWIKNKFLTLKEQIVCVKRLGSSRITVHPIHPSPARCWGAAIVYKAGILLMAYSSFLRAETKDQTADLQGGREKQTNRRRERAG